MLLNLFLFLSAGIVILLLVTQIILPFTRGTPFFPTFRRITPMKARVDVAAEQLSETIEYVALKEELDEINRRKAELEKK